MAPRAGPSAQRATGGRGWRDRPRPNGALSATSDFNVQTVHRPFLLTGLQISGDQREARLGRCGPQPRKSWGSEGALGVRVLYLKLETDRLLSDCWRLKHNRRPPGW